MLQCHDLSALPSRLHDVGEAAELGLVTILDRVQQVIVPGSALRSCLETDFGAFMGFVRCAQLVHVPRVVRLIEVPDAIAVILVSELVTHPTHFILLTPAVAGRLSRSTVVHAQIYNWHTSDSSGIAPLPPGLATTCSQGPPP